MDRRNLFKGLIALPIVLLGSKLGIAKEDKLTLDNLQTTKKQFSYERSKPIVYWKGTNVPITSPLYVTFLCGHEGSLYIVDRDVYIIYRDSSGYTKELYYFDPRYVKNTNCPNCEIRRYNTLYALSK